MVRRAQVTARRERETHVGLDVVGEWMDVGRELSLLGREKC
jgi:hypothetical protein